MSTNSLNSGVETKIALEAIKGSKSVKELCVEYDVSEQQIVCWRTHLLLSVGSVLDEGALKNVDHKRAELYRKIGRLHMENEMLRKLLGR